MMEVMDKCKRLAEIAEEFSRTHDQKVMEQTRGLGDMSDCILSGLYDAAAVADWKRFGNYVIAAIRQPDKSMTTILSVVLDTHPDDVPANVVDDVVDLLNDIGDPAAVGSLERTMLNPPEWDEYYHLARKCMWALLKIGTPEAVNAVRRATQSDIPEVREEALRKLKPGSG